MTFDGVTLDDLLLPVIRYAKLLFGIIVPPVIYTVLKGKLWSLAILKVLFTIFFVVIKKRSFT